MIKINVFGLAAAIAQCAAAVFMVEFSFWLLPFALVACVVAYCLVEKSIERTDPPAGV